MNKNVLHCNESPSKVVVSSVNNFRIKIEVLRLRLYSFLLNTIRDTWLSNDNKFYSSWVFAVEDWMNKSCVKLSVNLWRGNPYWHHMKSSQVSRFDWNRFSNGTFKDIEYKRRNRPWSASAVFEGTLCQETKNKNTIQRREKHWFGRRIRATIGGRRHVQMCSYLSDKTALASITNYVLSLKKRKWRFNEL